MALTKPTKSSALSATRLREVVTYEPLTGLFRWREYRGHWARAGDVAGSLDKSSGYVQICIDQVSQYAHRLAWLYTHGRWPEGLIDHENHDRSDNRIDNLRDVSIEVNNANPAGARAHSRSGIPGVYQLPNGRWCAYITRNRKRKHLGVFRTAEAAGQKVQDARAAVATRGAGL